MPQTISFPVLTIDGVFQMPNFSRYQQFDLFEAQQEPPQRRGGIPRHIPTIESISLANELKAAGKTQVAIAKVLGIGVRTFEKYYLPRNPASQPTGRRRHSPTPATRKIVRRAVLAGMKPLDVAKLIRISPPTLRLYYRDELPP